MAFQPGQSGNPGGRPKDSPLRRMAQRVTRESIETVIEIMRNKKAPAAVRVTAAFGLLDRAYGKPIQMTELTGKDGEKLFDTSNTLEVARSIAFLLAGAAQEVEHESLH
jgi:hypothetical protein